MMVGCLCLLCLLKISENTENNDPPKTSDSRRRPLNYRALNRHPDPEMATNLGSTHDPHHHGLRSTQWIRRRHVSMLDHHPRAALIRHNDQVVLTGDQGGRDSKKDVTAG